MSALANSGRSTFLLVLFFAVLVLANSEKLFQVDDTFITLQYARNLVEHGVLTWHPDLPVVDGYTSLAHTLLLALGQSFGMDGVAWASLVSFGSATILLILCQRQIAQYPLGPQTVGLSFLTLNAGLIYWTNAGLDAVFYTLIFFLVYLAYRNDLKSGRLRWQTIGLLLFFGVVRPEGALISLALLAYFFVLHWVSGSLRGSRFWSGCVIVLATIAAQVIWRMHVYGHPLPNTFYAKASAERALEIEFGLIYLQAWLIFSCGAVALVVSGLSFWITRDPIRVLFILGQLVLTVVSGGDAHAAERFFLPIVPLVAVDFAILSKALGRPILIAGLLVLSVWSTRQSTSSLQSWTFPNPARSYQNLAGGHWPLGVFEPSEERVVWARASIEIGEILPADTPVAATDVGALALYSGLPVLDAFGLNHAEIASLPKPEGFRNEWGVYRLDVLLKSDPPVIYLDLPQFYDWTFDQVAAGEVSCDGLGKERILDLVANFEEPLAEGFQCISLPSKSQPGLWQNILVAKERPEVLSSAPAGTLRSDCLADLMKACRAENIGTKN